MRARVVAAAAVAALLVPACRDPHCATPRSKPLGGTEARMEVAVVNGYLGTIDVNGRHYTMPKPPAPPEGGQPAPGPFRGLPDGTYPATFRATGGGQDGGEVAVTMDVAGTPRTASMGGPIGCE